MELLVDAAALPTRSFGIPNKVGLGPAMLLFRVETNPIKDGAGTMQEAPRFRPPTEADAHSSPPIHLLAGEGVAATAAAATKGFPRGCNRNPLVPPVLGGPPPDAPPPAKTVVVAGAGAAAAAI